MYQRFIIICISFICFFNVSNAAEEIRILGIGNSFTINAFKYLDALSEASPTHKLILGRATIGGCSLEKHAGLLKANQADSSQGLGYLASAVGIKGATKVSLIQALQAQPWDIVTIQQLSKLSPDYATYQPYADEICAAIKQYAPQAEIVIHQTWAYRVDGDFAKIWPDKKGYGQKDMYRDSLAAYKKLAEELGLRRIPVGTAFQVAREARPLELESKPDADCVEPDKPNDKNSLNVGWRWRNGKLGKDTHHANIRGEVLAGAVWYEFLTGQDVRELQCTIPDVEPEDQAFLFECAHAVVSEGKEPAISADSETPVEEPAKAVPVP